MTDNGAGDLKREISEFIRGEMLLYGTERADRAAVIINDFSTSMCEDHKKNDSEWDVETMRACLMKEVADTPGIIRERGRGVVPLICRFLLYLHEPGTPAGFDSYGECTPCNRTRIFEKGRNE
ncbi:MAG: hypothetical protein NTV68_02410 [Methanomicrobiales archaeon]|nr:hypothetical protein [Methanomicrobiales archaeon]